MEASALRAPAVHRRSLATPLLRLRSDEQLIALFRAGSEDAFGVIHDRYRQRLFGYVRQMLATGPRADAEDVLQDVFVRAYGALRNDDRDVNLRAWLYRVAHNRCIDHLRRPTPAASEIFDMSRTPLQDPMETAQRRDDLRRLVEDVGRLPDQQRSAILMREIDGLAYADIAEALEVTVPAVKSLLVRARTGLVEAIEARDTDCSVIRSDLMDSYDRGVKASGRARRHMRECSGCREYRGTLKTMRRSFAALSPVVGFAPLALAAKALGIGGAGGGGAAAGVGGAGAVSGTLIGATATKVAVVVAGAALAGGTAAEVHHLTKSAPTKTAHTSTAASHKAVVAAPVTPAVARRRADASAPVLPVADAKDRGAKQDNATAVTETPSVAVETDPVIADPGTTADGKADQGDGGTTAPDEVTSTPQTTIKTPASSTPTPTVTAAPTAVPSATATPAATPPSSGPPPEH